MNLIDHAKTIADAITELQNDRDRFKADADRLAKELRRTREENDKLSLDLREAIKTIHNVAQVLGGPF